MSVYHSWDGHHHKPRPSRVKGQALKVWFNAITPLHFPPQIPPSQIEKYHSFQNICRSKALGHHRCSCCAISADFTLASFALQDPGTSGRRSILYLYYKVIWVLNRTFRVDLIPPSPVWSLKATLLTTSQLHCVNSALHERLRGAPACLWECAAYLMVYAW